MLLCLASILNYCLIIQKRILTGTGIVKFNFGGSCGAVVNLLEINIMDRTNIGMQLRCSMIVIYLVVVINWTGASLVMDGCVLVDLET